MGDSIYDYVSSEASSSATGGWNTAENQDPSTVNNGMRAHKQNVANFLKDHGAVNTVSGTDTIAITAAMPIAAYANGMRLAFTAAATNTGAATANVNAIGAKAIRKISGGTDVALVAGDILAGGFYDLIYDSAANSAAGAWILLNPANKITGGQIKFPATQNASSDANTLDDYEEGTFTPVPTYASGTAASITVNTGVYTKIGRQVMFALDLSFRVGTGSGAFTITGLPFSAVGGNVAVAIGYLDLVDTVSATHYYAYVASGTANISIRTKLFDGTNTAMGTADATHFNASATDMRVMISGVYNT